MVSCRIYQNIISSNRVMIQTVTLSQTVQCVTGKTRCNSTPIPKASQLNRLRWRIESCQGSSSEACDTLMCDRGKLWPSFSNMCKRASLISIYSKAFQLVSLAVDWIAQCSQCVARSVWLWPHLSKVAIAKKFERDSSCFLPIFWM